MKVLISQEKIQDRITELSDSINKFILEKYPNDDIVFICVLTGSIFFFSELLRKIKIEVITDYIKISSYQGKSTSYNVKILKDISVDITDKVVFVIEDIVDTGLTLNKIISLFRERNPKDIIICTLLDKPSQRIIDVKIDFVGFEIPPEFVVGYGLDYNEKFRNKPYIYCLEEDEYAN